jgi:hypothetical protein
MSRIIQYCRFKREECKGEPLVMFFRIKDGHPQYRAEYTTNWIAEPLAQRMYEGISYVLVPEGQPFPLYAEV